MYFSTNKHLPHAYVIDGFSWFLLPFLHNVSSYDQSGVLVLLLNMLHSSVTWIWSTHHYEFRLDTFYFGCSVASHWLLIIAEGIVLLVLIPIILFVYKINLKMKLAEWRFYGNVLHKFHIFGADWVNEIFRITITSATLCFLGKS